MRMYFVFIALVLSIMGFGQCPEEDVLLLGQAEVDNFSVEYPNCDAIEGFLIIQGSDITDVSSLSQINSVGSLLVNETALTSLQGLEALTITGLSDEDAFIVIDDNPLLQNIEFLDTYTVNIPVVFLIRDMENLTSLEGAGQIDEVVTLILENNDTLTDLNGLNENLNIVGGLVQSPFLYIGEHANLTDISRLNTAQFNNFTSAEIINNTQLSVCENDLVCTLIANNSITILDNAVGCSTRSEVQLACNNLSLQQNEIAEFKLHPNPVSGALFIDDVNTHQLINVKLYSSMGIKVFETNEKEIDFTNFQSGMYLIEITTKKGSLTKVVIKE